VLFLALCSSLITLPIRGGLTPQILVRIFFKGPPKEIAEKKQILINKKKGQSED
jgi:hypothetical protein